MSSSCGGHRLERAGPGRPIHGPLDVVPRPIAADERPAELDRGAFRVERNAFDEQRRGAASLPEEASLSSPEEDGLEGLARAYDVRRIARDEKVVEGVALQVGGEQARESLGGQVHLLEQVGLTRREAEALEVDRRLARLQRERRRDRTGCCLGPGRDEAGLGIEAALAHLLGEACSSGDVAVEPGPEDERAASARPLDATLAHEFVQRAPDRDEAAAVVTCELTLGGELRTRRPAPLVQGATQVEIDLMVQRDRTELETKAGQRNAVPRIRWDALGGVLRVTRLLITL